MNFSRLAWLGLACAFSLFSSRAAFADGRNPGSLLIYPEFDNTPGRSTLLTLTNTNPDPLHGTVRVELVYINGSGAPPTLCTETNFTVTLTPNDTLTFLTSAQNPNMNRGYVYAFAKNVQNRAIAFDWLIGEDLLMVAPLSLEYSFNAVVYKAAVAPGALTDVDTDGIRDLDGVEYEMSPARMLIPRFMGQSAIYQSDLILVALTGGSEFTTLLDFLIYNDNEEVFSKNYSFRCWQKVSLQSISNLFDQTFLAQFTGHNVAEIIGSPATEAGWIEIDGASASSAFKTLYDPAFLAVLTERTTFKQVSELSFEMGKQANGDLLPHNVLGDNQ